MLHYHVKKFFSPIALSAYRDKKDDSIVVYVVRDHAIEGEKYICNVCLHDWRKFDIQWNKTWTLEISSLKHSVSLFNNFFYLIGLYLIFCRHTKFVVQLV